MSAARGASRGGGAATDSYEGVAGASVVDVHGLLDTYVQHALQAPGSPTTQLRAFDVRSNTPSLNLFRLSVAHRPDAFGFRLDAGLGDTANGYLRSDPAAESHPDESRGLSYIHQAFVTAVIPAGRGIAIDVGKFGTPVGLEDNETPTNWNYSRSLLYTFAEPTFHTGARATYPLTDALAVSVRWVNGWNTNLAAGNAMRSVAAAVTYRPNDRLEVVVDGVFGLERAPTPE